MTHDGRIFGTNMTVMGFDWIRKQCEIRKIIPKKLAIHSIDTTADMKPWIGYPKGLRVFV